MSEETQAEKHKWKINWTTDKIMSTSALFISVISLIALLYQSYLAREENKLIQKQQSASVLPYLNQWYTDSNEKFQLVIGNKGVGPAFITKVELTLDSIYKFDNSDDLFRKLFKDHEGMDTIPYTTSTLIKGFVLPANDQINIIEIRGQDNIAAFGKAMSKSDIQYEITYEDVYGTMWILNDKENTPILLPE
ncbi:hypothetical protein [uncultured Psychroserpens sp.]|uniref:hypothetical protein n=1 Tax=uncultured Psychroserpens sp. TaxID=255436 RepID=UPI002617A8E2|nr:hypothetical protein [uncultured Psychroserpens sp.]